MPMRQKSMMYGTIAKLCGALAEWYFFGFRKCWDYGKLRDTLAQPTPQEIKVQPFSILRKHQNRKRLLAFLRRQVVLKKSRWVWVRKISVTFIWVKVSFIAADSPEIKLCILQKHQQRVETQSAQSIPKEIKFHIFAQRNVYAGNQFYQSIFRTSPVKLIISQKSEDSNHFWILQIQEMFMTCKNWSLTFDNHLCLWSSKSLVMLRRGNSQIKKM